MATPREALRVAPVAPADAPEVLALYRAVASAPSHGLARETDEIDLAYVSDFLERASRSGLSLGLRDETGALLSSRRMMTTTTTSPQRWCWSIQA